MIEETGTGLSRSKAGSRSTVIAMSVGTDVAELNRAKLMQLTDTACGPEQVEEDGAASKEVRVGASAWSSSGVTGGWGDSVKTGVVVGLDR